MGLCGAARQVSHVKSCTSGMGRENYSRQGELGAGRYTWVVDALGEWLGRLTVVAWEWGVM